MWLVTLLDKILCWLPRPIVVAPDESGYRTSPRFRGGMKVKSLGPGCYLWLPLIQKAEKIEIKTQVKDLRAQSVWTKDEENITISGAIRYKITNATNAILEVFDFDNNIQTIALATIHEFVNQHTLQECRRQTPELMKIILDKVREESRGWGLKIENVYLTDTGDVFNLRML